MKARPDQFDPVVAVTGQHRRMLDQVLSVFRIVPDFDLDLMAPGQTLTALSSRLLAAMEPVFAAVRPDIAYVQGDTTTTLCGAMAAFYAGVPVGHIEAGLRTGDLRQPFPEEMNRVVTGRLATLHFAATVGARENLLREGISAESIYVTGNSGIDAVLGIRDRLASGELSGGEWDFTRPIVLVTAHRRESFGEGIGNICRAVRRIAARGDVQVVFPVHRNPEVLGPAERMLGGVDGVRLMEPLEYLPFVDMMLRASVVLTDSGGVQEEGPSLGKPVLVMREKTERPEAVEAGTVRLVGTDEERIVAAVSELLDDPAAREAMCRVHNPYGDGHASAGIAEGTLNFFGLLR